MSSAHMRPAVPFISSSIFFFVPEGRCILLGKEMKPRRLGRGCGSCTFVDIGAGHRKGIGCDWSYLLHIYHRMDKDRWTDMTIMDFLMLELSWTEKYQYHTFLDRGHMF